MRKHSIRVTLAFLLYLFIASPVIAQTFPLDASLWLVDPQQPDQGVAFNKKGSVAFNFPDGSGGGNPAYTGNLLLPWSQSLIGSQFTATFQVVTFPAGSVPVRFIAADGGSPSTARFYFQTGTLYNDTDGSRWWSNPIAWEIEDATVVMTVDLSPSSWSSTFGHRGDELPSQFADALAHPTYVGVTFGAIFWGHGVQTRKGSAQFRLSGYALQ